MGRLCFRRCRLSRIMGSFQIILGGLVVIVSITSLFRFYSAGFFLHDEDICRHFYGVKDVYDGVDLKALSDRVEEVLTKMASLQDKLESSVQHMEKNTDTSDKMNISRLEYKKFLEEEVIQPLYSAHISLRQIRLPRVGVRNTTMKEDPLINFFTVEEIRKYITPKENRVGNINIYGTERIYNTIGHACVSMKKEVERYMNYDIGSYCNDDWNLAQKLLMNGCDPLPRRRCLARASKLYQKPYPINESLWKLPENRNVRWSNYQCKNFECLSSKNPKRGYSKCSGCFELEKERVKWVTNGSLPVDFLISDVLAIKPEEIRIGLDFGVSTGTFAARMREQNVTVISTALNLGAPFSEMIALRGLVPLYATLNQRLPLFDNTMDLIHTTGFLDGWIDLQLMDFILFDWDRVLRPGGLLWIDRFFCSRKDLDDYMYMFLQFRSPWLHSKKLGTKVSLIAVAVNAKLQYGVIGVHSLLEDVFASPDSGKRRGGNVLKGQRKPYLIVESRPYTKTISKMGRSLSWRKYYRVGFLKIALDFKMDLWHSITESLLHFGHVGYWQFLKYGLSILSPVDDDGKSSEESGQCSGLDVPGDGNVAVVKYLDEHLSIIMEEPYNYQYPYDRRTKKPTIFRVTEQWFASVEGFRQDRIDAIGQAENRIPATDFLLL
ncbi:hypothetical protein HHK36_012450 [Tetracentron sinense]|uniref:S-adenosyl-L-methionine-dependent methyltransferase n=1 Tax=Tetracentron sinense TaxID=13715 RepID=A0A834Z6V5_TETSI|nr:hypothetical protein HHK36_012450 [Tetracentron sinense]